MRAPILTAQPKALEDLVADIRSVVQTNSDAGKIGNAVAALLPDYLTNDELLAPEQVAGDVSGYRQHILHVEPDGSFSVVALVWLPGQATPIHDHVSWCVVGVYRGEEHETTYVLRNGKREPHLVATGEHVNLRGTVASLVPPGDIHAVQNAGHSLAVSLHVYGADIRELGCSIRRRYEQPVRSA